MSNGIAVAIVPGELSLLVARTNGSLTPLHQLSCELPPDAVRAGLQAPNLPHPEAISTALREFVQRLEPGGARGRVVAVLIPDAAVRMALIPLEGTEPARTEGEAMARWALRGLLSIDVAAARVDWSVVAEDRSTEPVGRWLLAVGADAAVVREYESVVEQVGWVAGRVVPLTMALAVGTGSSIGEVEPGAARILLSGIGGQVACLVEADGVPRVHRAWRGESPDLARELAAIRRYADQRLGLSIVDAVLVGPEGWLEQVVARCEALGWKVHVSSCWTAHLGAVQT